MWGTDHEDQVGSEAFDERFVFEVIFFYFFSCKVYFMSNISVVTCLRKH